MTDLYCNISDIENKLKIFEYEKLIKENQIFLKAVKRLIFSYKL